MAVLTRRNNSSFGGSERGEQPRNGGSCESVRGGEDEEERLPGGGSAGRRSGVSLSSQASRGSQNSQKSRASQLASPVSLAGWSSGTFMAEMADNWVVDFKELVRRTQGIEERCVGGHYEPPCLQVIARACYMWHQDGGLWLCS